MCIHIYIDTSDIVENCVAECFNRIFINLKDDIILNVNDLEEFGL